MQVSGRGRLHLTVLIETMRREGFELLVGPPTVITKKVDGKTYEPFENVEVQVGSFWRQLFLLLLFGSALLHIMIQLARFTPQPCAIASFVLRPASSPVIVSSIRCCLSCCCYSTKCSCLPGL